MFFIVETICYENNILFAFYYNVSLQVIFSTEKQDSRFNCICVIFQNPVFQ